MRKTLRSKKFKSLMPYFLLAIAVIIAFRVIMEFDFFVDIFTDVTGQMWTILAPFFYGFILAYIVNIPIGAMQRLLARTKSSFVQKRARMFSALIIIVIIVVIITLALNLMIPAIADSVMLFVSNIPTYIEGITQFVEDFNERNIFGWYISSDGLVEMFVDMLGDLTFETLMSPINAIMGAATAVYVVAIAFISSIYILAEKDKLKDVANRFLKVCMPKNVFATTLDLINKLNYNFRQYIRTQTIDGVILGTMATVALLFIRSPFALVLGLMLGVFNYVPYFGSIFGTLIAVLVVMFTQGFTMGLITAAVLLVIQQIDANVIQPRLMSGSFALSPLLVIISITTGGALGGVMGMIVAIPIVAVLRDIYDTVVSYYEKKKFGELTTAEGEVEDDGLTEIEDE